MKKALRSIRNLVAERRIEDGIMTLIHEHVSRMFSRLPRPHAGVAVMYDPSDGTAEAIIGPTAAIIGDDGDSAVNPTRIPLSHQYGDQVGLRGGERVVLVDAPTQSGFLGFTHYGPDDSPGAPAGEIWRVHRNADGEIDAYQKFTNDGDAGDGKGGIQELAGSYWQRKTAGGITITADDATDTVTVAIGGLSIVVNGKDGIITLGGGDDLGAGFALIRESDLNSALSAQMNQLKTELTTWAAAHLQPGAGAAGPTTLTAVTSTGSSKVQSA